jgi:hypothetical protein
MSDKAQSFKNHTRFVPLFHGFAFPVTVINAVWMLARAVRQPSFDTVMATVMAIAIVVAFFYLRIFALTVQDRVIRLEMRLRLREILPGDLAARIHELQPGQLIALRFASDRELPELVREVLTNNTQDRDVIKRKVRDWQADHLRC